jgi:hypothetical protein
LARKILGLLPEQLEDKEKTAINSSFILLQAFRRDYLDHHFNCVQPKSDPVPPSEEEKFIVLYKPEPVSSNSGQTQEEKNVLQELKEKFPSAAPEPTAQQPNQSVQGNWCIVS